MVRGLHFNQSMNTHTKKNTELSDSDLDQIIGGSQTICSDAYDRQRGGAPVIGALFDQKAPVIGALFDQKDPIIGLMFDPKSKTLCPRTY